MHASMTLGTAVKVPVMAVARTGSVSMRLPADHATHKYEDEKADKDEATGASG